MSLVEEGERGALESKERVSLVEEDEGGAEWSTLSVQARGRDIYFLVLPSNSKHRTGISASVMCIFNPWGQGMRRGSVDEGISPIPSLSGLGF